MNPMKTKSIYKQLLGSSKRAITPHMEYLAMLASHCRVACEFGVRGGGSTAALLRGVHDHLFSYDIQLRPSDQYAWNRLKVEVKHTNKEWTFILKDALTVDLPECELLVDDSMHRYDFTSQVLETHHEKVSRWIVFHDTEVFGRHGQVEYTAGELNEKGNLVNDPDPTTTRGMKDAIEEFIENHPEWAIVRHVTHSAGLTTLGRVGNGYDQPQHHDRADTKFED